MIILMPVHCCCEPERRLGFILMSSEQIREGARVTFLLERMSIMHLQVGEQTEPPETLTLTIDRLYQVNRRHYLALKSNDFPIEQLRRISGWEDR